ncbi:MAG: hypothetical protein Tsb0014_10270 [Pleurocapsa sp.]
MLLRSRLKGANLSRLFKTNIVVLNKNCRNKIPPKSLVPRTEELEGTKVNQNDYKIVFSIFGNYRNEENNSFAKFFMSLSNQTANPNTQQIINLSPVESFTGIMLATMAVDGHISSEEKQNLVVTLNRMKLFKDYDREHIANTIKELINVIKNQGADALLMAGVSGLPEYLYETAFVISTDLILSDGKVANEELSILSKLSEALSIPQDKVDTIIEIMMIKNKG